MREIEQLSEILAKFRRLTFYNPSKGMLTEALNSKLNNYVCVGEVNYWPWGGNKDKVYVMVSPEKIMRWGEEVYDVQYTENADGTGKSTEDIPVFYKRHIKIYDEHKNDKYGELFLGKQKNDNEIEAKHKEFEDKLFKINGNIIIHHNSNYAIKDGVVKKGKMNTWSNNSDIGIYLWGSRNSGNDPSNVSTYTYYCIISPEDLYDFHTNKKRYISLDQAMSREYYVGQLWNHGGDAVVVSTLHPTPIWCILDKQNGKWYNKEWQEIQKPF